MKSLLSFIILYFICFIAPAQTWTGQAPDDNWSTGANWNTGVVPTSIQDVIIPTGFTVNLNVAGSIKSIDIQGNSVLNMDANLTFTANSQIASNATVNWTNGILNGTGRTLENLGTIALSGSGNKFLGTGIRVNNQGLLTLEGTGSLFLNQSSELVNFAAGVIDLKSGGSITFNVNPIGQVLNHGLIKRTTATGIATIDVPLTNNDGIISVEMGTLTFQNANTTFNDGTYNVFSSATMNWNNIINPTGTLSGTLDGDLNWNNTLNVPMGATVNLDFNATDKFNWKGTLRGGGTLANINVLNISGSHNSFIANASTLNNLGTINFTGTSGLFLNESSTLNNPIGSVIDFQSDGGNVAVNVNPAGLFHNEGLIKKTTSSGAATILAPITNNDGIIQVESGILNIQSSDTNFIDGTYNVST
ncbi:MAG: hypothetical protein NWQ19_04535, partial [Nonlabens sp.]|nr:hypothetical protein [Nonlabens sp.]